MSEKIPVQVIEETKDVVEIDSNPDSNIDKSVDRSEDVEISAGEKENVKTAQIDDLSPEVVEKANVYITIVSENKESQVDLKSQLNKMEWNDPQKPLVERELRQAEKEQSRFNHEFNHELLNADNNLLRAERQLYDNFVEASESKEEKIDPEEVIAKFDDKFASLTASVAELDKYIEERRMAYHLNTKRAYEDVVLGPKMRERDSIKEELSQVQKSWLQLGGGTVDKAREMVAVKRAYDLLSEQASQEGVGNERSEAEGAESQEAKEIPGLEEEASGAESGAEISDEQKTHFIQTRRWAYDDLLSEQASQEGVGNERSEAEGAESQEAKEIPGLEEEASGAESGAEILDTSEMLAGYEKRLRSVEYDGNPDFYHLFGDIEKEVMQNQALSDEQKTQLHGELVVLLGNISGNESEGKVESEEASGASEAKTEQSESDDRFQSIDKTYDWSYDWLKGAMASGEGAEEKDHHKAEEKQQKEKSGFFKGLFRRGNSAKRDKLSLGTGGDGGADKKRNNALLGLSLWYLWGKN